MGRRRAANNSKHLKTRHKKRLINRKIVTRKVDGALKNINKTITQQVHADQQAEGSQGEKEIQLEAEPMSMEAFQKLLRSGKEKKEKEGKFSVDDRMYLEKLMKKWGSDYGRMAQDIRLNRLQWTAHQIEKKHKTYQKLFPEAKP